MASDRAMKLAVLDNGNGGAAAAAAAARAAAVAAAEAAARNRLPAVTVRMLLSISFSIIGAGFLVMLAWSALLATFACNWFDRATGGRACHAFVATFPLASLLPESIDGAERGGRSPN